MVHWYGQNDEKHTTIPLTVEKGDWPWFYPTKYRDLVEVFNIDVKRFECFDWPRYDWVLCSANSPPRDLRLPGQLSFRTLGVTRAPEMPGQASKRTAAEALDEVSPERTPAAATSSNWLTTPRPHENESDRSIEREVGRLGLLTPRSSHSSLHASQAPSPAMSQTPSTVSVSSAGGASPRTGPWRDLPKTVVPPLPALFPGLGAGPSEAHMKDIFNVTALDVNVPRAPGGYPLRYVVDMAIGFHLVCQLEDRNRVARAVAFQQVFGHKYSSSTWSDHTCAWDAACAVEGESERWIQYGRTKHGEWSAFMSQWRRDRKKRT
ncbi:hypothetical protein C8Q76DRAFT_788959 [Earliella scabrosa]|nr:hypothetical protein C8Q76DRAFT_788959 [Earliella scabrosa]